MWDRVPRSNKRFDTVTSAIFGCRYAPPVTVTSIGSSPTSASMIEMSCGAKLQALLLFWRTVSIRHTVRKPSPTDRGCCRKRRISIRAHESYGPGSYPNIRNPQRKLLMLHLYASLLDIHLNACVTNVLFY